MTFARARLVLRLCTALLAVVAVLMCTLTASPAIAKAKKTVKQPPASVVLHPKLYRSPGGFLISDDQYVYLGGSRFVPAPGVLIDESTGKQTSIPVPPATGCSFPALPGVIGGPWLVFGCGEAPSTTFELYDIPTGAWQPFTPSPDVALNCASTGGSCSVAGIGTDWIALFPACAGECGSVLQFQNLQTGQSEADPRNKTTTVDLNSPTLTAKACSPLTVPESLSADGEWGSLTPDDGFEIAAGAGGVYLEKCGSKLHEFLTDTTGLDLCPVGPCAPLQNSHVIIWQAGGPGRLSGIFLPSRQRFSIPVSANLEPLALTSTTLYLENGNGRIWATPSPSPPTARKPRHS